MSTYNFDDFHGNEAEQYRFYMIPQLLFTDEKFSKLSADSKILYGLMLDRVSLSYQNSNRFTDENGRTFIYYTAEKAMEMLHCATEKVTRIFKELENIGLIERKKQGLGKPTKIYVKHFNRLSETNNTPMKNTENDDTTKKNESKQTENQDFRKSKDKPFRNRKSVHSEIESQNVRKSKSNHTNLSQTDINHTQSVRQSPSVLEINENIQPNESQKTDRLTDIHKEKSFNEVLSDIGYKNTSLSKESFQYGFESSDIELLKSCEIPYEYHSDTSSLKVALDFFVQWDYAYNGFTAQSDKDLFSRIVDLIYEFMTKEKTHFKDKTITSKAVFDSINRKIQAHGDLYSWIILAMDEWKIVTSKVDVKRPMAYMRICIWNWLSSSELEIAEKAFECTSTPIQSTHKQSQPKNYSNYNNSYNNDFGYSDKINNSNSDEDMAYLQKMIDSLQ